MEVDFIHTLLGLGLLPPAVRVFVLRTFARSAAVASVCALATAGAPALANPTSASFAGTWLGSLEYRDYSNGARVTLPTLLTVGRRDGGFVFFYAFDDGGGKVVRDRESVGLDFATRSYVVDDGTAQGRDAYHIESVEGFGADGGGCVSSVTSGGATFVASGMGTENDAAVEVRETVTLTETTLTLLRETRPRGSNVEFAFRHRYRLSRISPRG